MSLSARSRNDRNSQVNSALSSGSHHRLLYKLTLCLPICGIAFPCPSARSFAAGAVSPYLGTCYPWGVRPSRPSGRLAHRCGVSHGSCSALARSPHPREDLRDSLPSDDPWGPPTLHASQSHRSQPRKMEWRYGTLLAAASQSRPADFAWNPQSWRGLPGQLPPGTLFFPFFLSATMASLLFLSHPSKLHLWALARQSELTALGFPSTHVQGKLCSSKRLEERGTQGVSSGAICPERTGESIGAEPCF